MSLDGTLCSSQKKEICKGWRGQHSPMIDDDTWVCSSLWDSYPAGENEATLFTSQSLRVGTMSTSSIRRSSSGGLKNTPSSRLGDEWSNPESTTTEIIRIFKSLLRLNLEPSEIAADMKKYSADAHFMKRGQRGRHGFINRKNTETAKLMTNLQRSVEITEKRNTALAGR